MDTLPRFVVHQAKVQGVAAFLFGLMFIIAPNQVFNNPLAKSVAAMFGLPDTTNAPLTPLAEQLSTLAGVFCIAIGSAYGLALAHGYEQWFYITIPGRLIVSAVSLVVCLLAPGKISPPLISVMLWDGSVALVGAYLMGDFTGRKLASKRAVKGK